MRSLIERVRARGGGAEDAAAAILDTIADWHEWQGDPRTLAEAIGWTEAEYRGWIAGASAVDIMRRHFAAEVAA